MKASSTVSTTQNILLMNARQEAVSSLEQIKCFNALEMSIETMLM
jgi:hypothetical protein